MAYSNIVGAVALPLTVPHGERSRYGEQSVNEREELDSGFVPVILLKGVSDIVVHFDFCL